MAASEILIVVSLLLSGASLALAAYIVYKVRRMHVTLEGSDYVARNLSVSLSQNLQNLDILVHELRLERPLPVLRGWAASPDVLLTLVRHIRRHRPRVIVECGSGASTVVLAQALKLNGVGRVVSIDHDAEFAQRSRGMLKSYGLAEWAEVVHAPLRRVEIDGSGWDWYDCDLLPDTPPIDLLFIDGPPADATPVARYPAGPLLFPRLAPAGTIFVDDAARPGEIEVLRRWAAEFPSFAQLRHYCEKGCCELRPRPLGSQRGCVGAAA